MSWSCFLCGTFFFFFFSSRRRHTRFDCDWSSDVCSSDLVFGTVGVGMDVGHVRFQVLERFNSYARREDVDISQLLHIGVWAAPRARSEEHTSELQSQSNLVCRLLLEKKKKNKRR